MIRRLIFEIGLNQFNYFITILVGLLFILFSYLQLNDPDSLIWIMVYLFPAILSFVALKNYIPKYFQYVSLIYLIMAIYMYFNNSETMVMYIFDETTNESLGLLLCSIWIFILPLLKNLR